MTNDKRIHELRQTVSSICYEYKLQDEFPVRVFDRIISIVTAHMATEYKPVKALNIKKVVKAVKLAASVYRAEAYTATKPPVPDTMDRYAENSFLKEIKHITDNFQGQLDNEDIEDIKTFIFKEYAHYGDLIKVRETIHPVVAGMCIYITNKKQPPVAEDDKIRDCIVRILCTNFAAIIDSKNKERDPDIIDQLEDYVRHSIKVKEIWTNDWERTSTFASVVCELYPFLHWCKYEAKPRPIDVSKIDFTTKLTRTTEPPIIYTLAEARQNIHKDE